MEYVTQKTQKKALILYIKIISYINNGGKQKPEEVFKTMERKSMVKSKKI